MLTVQDIKEISDIIESHMTAFAVDAFGPQVVPQAEIDRLVSMGVLTPEAARRLAVDFAGDAFLTGVVIQRLEEAGVDAAGWSVDQIRAELKRRAAPLTKVEKDAIEYVRLRGAQHCRGLGNKMDAATMSDVLAYDNNLEARMMLSIQDKTEAAIEARHTAQQLRSELGNATNDWARDWDRIARTEMQEAANMGCANRILDVHGADARVARIPEPGACKSCNSLFLDDEGKPRIFTIAELGKNGNNVGRKQADWRPVLTTVHPNCRCRTVFVPPGKTMNKDFEIVAAQEEEE